MSGSTIELHGAFVDTSWLPSFCACSHAADSRMTCLTLTPICRHWSMSHTPTGSYGIGTARLVSVNVRFSCPASFSRRRASARAALMSVP